MPGRVRRWSAAGSGCCARRCRGRGTNVCWSSIPCGGCGARPVPHPGGRCRMRRCRRCWSPRSPACWRPTPTTAPAPAAAPRGASIAPSRTCCWSGWPPTPVLAAASSPRCSDRPVRPGVDDRAGSVGRTADHPEVRPGPNLDGGRVDRRAVAPPHRQWTERAGGSLGPWLFSPDLAHERHVGAEVLGHRFARLRDEAGVPDASLHRLRHTVATFLVARGQVLAAQARLGHADAATTLREYAHALPLTDGHVADAIDAHLHLDRDAGVAPDAGPRTAEHWRHRAGPTPLEFAPGRRRSPRHPGSVRRPRGSFGSAPQVDLCICADAAVRTGPRSGRRRTSRSNVSSACSHAGPRGATDGPVAGPGSSAASQTDELLTASTASTTTSTTSSGMNRNITMKNKKDQSTLGKDHTGSGCAGPFRRACRASRRAAGATVVAHATCAPAHGPATEHQGSRRPRCARLAARWAAARCWPRTKSRSTTRPRGGADETMIDPRVTPARRRTLGPRRH